MPINLGDINFGLGPDTRRLDAARRSILNFGQAVNRVASSQSEGARKAEQAMLRQERAMLKALQTTMNLNTAIRSTGGQETLVNTTTASINRLVKALSTGKVSAKEFQRALSDFEATSGRVNRSLDVFKNQTLKAEKAQEQAAKAAVQFQMKTERAYHAAEMAVLRYNMTVSKLRPEHQTLFAGGADSALSQLKSSVSTSGSNPLAFQKAQQAFSKSMLVMNKDLDGFIAKTRNAALSGFEISLRRLADVSILLNGPLGGIAARLSLLSHIADSSSVRMAALSLALAAVAFAFTKVSQAAISGEKQFQRIEQGMLAVTGSTDKAAAMLDYVRDVSNRAGTQLATTAQQLIRLKAASAGTALEGDKTRMIFEKITFSAQKLGLSNDELEGTLRAVEQIMSKGSVQAEELRGQLGDRLPGAVNIMAASLGVTTKKLGEMMKKGQVSSDALVGFVDELAKRLGVDVTKSIETVIAAENRLADSWREFTNAVNDSFGISDAYVKVVNALAGALDWASNNMDKITAALWGIAAAASATYLILYGPGVFAGITALTSLLWGAVTATGGLTAAMTVLRGALITTGIGALVVGLGVLIYWIALSIEKMGGFAKAFQLLKDVSAESWDRIKQGVEVMVGGIANSLTRLRAVFFEVLAAIVGKFADATQKIADGWNYMMSTMGVESNAKGFGSDFVASLDASAKALNDKANIVADRLNTAWNRVKAPLKSIAEFNRGLIEDNKDSGMNNPNIWGDSPTFDPNGGGGGGSKGPNAILDAMRKIQELNDQIGVLQLPKWQQEYAKTQAEINKQVMEFADSLTKAGVPAEKVKNLTGEYADKLRELKGLESVAKSQVTMWEVLNNAIGSGLDSMGKAFVDAMKTGGDAMDALKDIVRNTVADIAQQFIQLAWINPLKNWLFGGDSSGNAFPTFSGSTGGGSGGILGTLLGGLFGGFKANGGPLNSGKWYIAGENGPEPIWGGGNGAFAYANGNQMANAMSSGSSNAARSKLEVAVRVDEDGNWKAHVAKISGEVSSAITREGIIQYDGILPSRVNQISADPRKS